MQFRYCFPPIQLFLIICTLKIQNIAFIIYLPARSALPSSLKTGVITTKKATLKLGPKQPLERYNSGKKRQNGEIGYAEMRKSATSLFYVFLSHV